MLIISPPLTGELESTGSSFCVELPVVKLFQGQIIDPTPYTIGLMGLGEIKLGDRPSHTEIVPLSDPNNQGKTMLRLVLLCAFLATLLVAPTLAGLVRCQKLNEACVPVPLSCCRGMSCKRDNFGGGFRCEQGRGLLGRCYSRGQLCTPDLGNNPCCNGLVCKPRLLNPTIHESALCPHTMTSHTVLCLGLLVLLALCATGPVAGHKEWLCKDKFESCTPAAGDCCSGDAVTQWWNIGIRRKRYRVRILAFAFPTGWVGVRPQH
ncbi:hypothetical protein EGW08_022555 [Elysia chlorotica]|uniref:Uncharacterized protein n=1 Tax=Elysia chlorotica TaxID=188477 RepID=A0A3S1BL64_ELYCH|nr:hypothetical protein EGW08_022555 [Elysia chlorotica]